ncbi:hypothetical protein [Dyadobacter crusticola]|uniref:hypothetical protein n=1 Tax=Dyadobacter crusticola TaxID=292407 RepID=UPI0004E1672D|nr:hypothetical protein [Dyadobacter crusticola]
MKPLYLALIALLLALLAGAQTSTINYQGVARSLDGEPLRFTTIAIRLSILAASGNTLYTEVKSVQTNGFGLYNISINDGTGTREGLFGNIDWSAPRFLKTEIDVENGSAFTDLGTTPIQSVPGALVARNLEGVINPVEGDILEFRNGKWARKPKSKRYHVAGIGNYNLGQAVSFVGPTATVTIERDNPTITIHMTRIFGSSMPDGAGGLLLNLGYRKQGGFPYEFDNSHRLTGVQVGGIIRMPVTLSGTYQTNFLEGETYELGLIGAAFEYENWNNNGKSIGYVEVS